MDSYSLVRPFFHLLPPEHAHQCALWTLKRGGVPTRRISAHPMLESRHWNLSFTHPVGLAAGFDKNAEAISSLHAQGFSFVEAGTVTPRPQEGNPKPRIFRLSQDRAVINRLGFNNQGLSVFTDNLLHTKKRGIIGANIGKNKDSEDALADYLACLERVYSHADYITINISSPNTQGLRALQKSAPLRQLLTPLVEMRNRLAAQHQTQVPLLLKIAPDLDDVELQDIASVVQEVLIDGMIISNTTIKRPRTLKSCLHGEQGGLSGAPLMGPSTEILSRMYQYTEGKIPLIGVGGISNAEDAYRKIRAGASLVQLYTALIYQGFGVVRQIIEELPALLERDKFNHISEAVGADHRA